MIVQSTTIKLKVIITCKITYSAAGDIVNESLSLHDFRAFLIGLRLPIVIGLSITSIVCSRSSASSLKTKLTITRCFVSELPGDVMAPATGLQFATASQPPASYCSYLPGQSGRIASSYTRCSMQTQTFPIK